MSICNLSRVVKPLWSQTPLVVGFDAKEVSGSFHFFFQGYTCGLAFWLQWHCESYRITPSQFGLADQTVSLVYIDSWTFVCIYIYIFTVVMQILALMYSIYSASKGEFYISKLNMKLYDLSAFLTAIG